MAIDVVVVIEEVGVVVLVIEVVVVPAVMVR